MLLTELRARLLSDPQVMEVDGILCRLPSHDPQLGAIVFWEPLLTNALPASAEQTAGLVERLAPLLSPLRVMTEGAQSNAEYEYHDISLAGWPEHRPLRTRKNAQSDYNRVRRDAEALALDEEGRDVVSFEPMSAAQSRAAMVRVMQEGSLTDCATIFSYLSAGAADFEWLRMWRSTTPYAYFLLQRPSPERAFSYYIWLHPEARASLATWHLINHLAGAGVEWFDCWNVAATPREQYKRALFTGLNPGRCFYQGWNPYPWLRED